VIRAGIWAALVAAVVLASRAVAYALAPGQAELVARLEHEGGGPRLAGVLGAGLAAAALVSAAVLWLAVVAVRERLALAPAPLLAPPRLAPGRLVRRGVLFVAVASLGFAVLESYLHWRAGLGWHGLHCLTGPVHRDALPVLAAFSLLAVAAHGAVEHLLAWARRLVALLAARLPLLRGPGRAFRSTARRLPERVSAAAAPRGPPAPAPA